MKKVQLYSHVGWFGICPVYVGELDSDEPHITPRVENWFFEFLFEVSVAGFETFFTAADLLFPKWQPGYPLFITGVLLVPHRYEYDDEEN